MAWLTGYSERALITVLAAQVGSGGCTNKDVLLTGANMPAALWSDALASGLDLRVTAADGETKVNHQLVSFTPGSSLMELYFLGASLSSAVNTEFYLYWNNPTDTGEAAAWAQGVWDSTWEIVHHWPNGSVLTALDSTANGNNAASLNGTSAAVGQINGGASFNGSSNYIGINNSASLQNWAYQTISVWIKANAGMGVFCRLVEKGANSEWTLNFNPGEINNKLLAVMGTVWTSGAVSSIAVADGTWRKIDVTMNYATKVVQIYLNGQPDNSRASTDQPPSRTNNICFGQYGGGGYRYSGIADEFRIGNTIRSDADILTAYNNQYSPSTFYTVGAVENAPGGGTVFFFRHNPIGPL